MPFRNSLRTTATGSPDERLAALFVLLLGSLEQRLAGIQTSENPQTMSRSIDIAMGLLVAIMDTGIGHFGDQCFSGELPAVWRLRERSQITLDVLDRESSGRLFTKQAKASTSTQVMYYNLGHGFTQVLRDLLTRLRERFTSESLSRDFQDSSELLIHDFEQRW